VSGLHGAYLACLRRRGGVVAQGRVFEGATASRGTSGWQVMLSSRSLSPDSVRAGILINAAGAWADDVARAAGVRPLGIRPLRRTVAQVRVDPPAPDAMPLVLDLSQRFYFKP